MQLQCFDTMEVLKSEFATSKSPSTHGDQRIGIFRLKERLLENLQFSRSCLQAPLRPVDPVGRFGEFGVFKKSDRFGR